MYTVIFFFRAKHVFIIQLFRLPFLFLVYERGRIPYVKPWSTYVNQYDYPKAKGNTIWCKRTNIRQKSGSTGYRCERRRIIEDEKEIAVLIEIYLVNGGYEVFKAYSGEEGREVNLTPTEFQILLLLASYRSRVFSADEIFERIWDAPFFEVRLQVNRRGDTQTGLGRDQSKFLSYNKYFFLFKSPLSNLNLCHMDRI